MIMSKYDLLWEWIKEHGTDNFKEALIKSSAHIAQSDLRTVSADRYALHTLIYDGLLRTQKSFQL